MPQKLHALGFLLVTILYIEMSHPAWARDVVILGTVTCVEKGDKAARPAKYILVYPDTDLEKAELSQLNGVYEIPMPRSVIGNYLNLFYKNDTRLLYAKRVGIWEQDVLNNRGSLQFSLDTVEFNDICENIEANRNKMFGVLDYVKNADEKNKKLLLAKDRSQVEPEWDTEGSLVMGGLVFSELGSAGTVAAAAGQPRNIETAGVKQHGDGKLLEYSLHKLTTNMGFNFAPSRKYSESIFWNPATLTYNNNHTVAYQSNLSEYKSFSASYRYNDKFTIAIGYLSLELDSDRELYINSNGAPVGGRLFIKRFSTDEEGKFLALVYTVNKKLHERLAFSLTAKKINQRIDSIPITYIMEPITNDFILSPNDVTEESFYDLDISTIIDLNSKVSMGISILNVLNQKMKTKVLNNTTDTSNPDSYREDDKEIDTRTYGYGVVYKDRATHYGLDITYNSETSGDAAIGVNHKISNSLLVNGGIDSLNSTLTLGINYSVFSYTYIRDDNVDSKHLLNVNINF